jgi:integrase
MGRAVKKSLPPYCYPKGAKGYIYFVRRGMCQRIKAAPGTAEFAAEYALLMKGKAAPSKTTFRALIEAYRKSPEWAKLAANTRKSYSRSMDYILAYAGNVDVRTFRRRHAFDMRNALADKPTTANRRIGFLSALLKWGVNADFCAVNVAAKIPELDATGRKRGPWPQDLVDAFREHATGRTALLFDLLTETGQRINDVLSMRWSDLDGDGISLTQTKTGHTIYIPLTARLRASLAQAPRKGLFIVAQDNGLRVGYNLAWKDIMAVRREIGAEDYDIHALRHYAASQIAALPGMTADHVRAITGHSAVDMVRLYSGKAMQKARAKEAQAARNGTKTDRES